MEALEQQHAQAGFELLDLAADGRLGEGQLVGRAREAQGARCGLERTQQVQRGQFDGRVRSGFGILWTHATSS